MAPSLVALLAAAKDHDAKQQNHRVKINKAIIEAGNVESTPPTPVAELVLTTEEEDDPFQGNLNNRRVAERIAGTLTHRKYLNNSEPTHVGDPQKALADIERSKRINPDPPQPMKDEEMPAIVLPPSPGSPAAVKAAQEAAGTAAAPAETKPAAAVWKPNA